ncbi:MAG TPA: serpin family protein, partial [Gemmatimonadaceae bacterium]|nr:serpin family protein [Gemmatimonadaceae bacterium]
DEPLSREAALFLASSVYFKGKWLDPFEKSATRPRDFTLHTGQRVAVPMMERTGSMAYQREPGYQMVRLPYRGGRVALYVILPDSGAADSGVADALLQRFAEHGWPQSLGAAQMRDVHLMLPKLRAELTLDLRPLLVALGAGVALDCQRADFADLAVEREADRPVALCVGRAVQRVYLDLDEEGTEAAAITGLGMTNSSYPPPPIPFLVDRPFLFVLRDESSGADLFVGRIQRP